VAGLKSPLFGEGMFITSIVIDGVKFVPESAVDLQKEKAAYLAKANDALQERNDWQVRTITMLVDEQLRLQDQVASLNKMNNTQAETIRDLHRYMDEVDTCRENQCKTIIGLYKDIDALQAQLESCKDQAVAEWILTHVHQSYAKEMETFFGRD
jgi:hypothetical protein